MRNVILRVEALRLTIHLLSLSLFICVFSAVSLVYMLMLIFVCTQALSPFTLLLPLPHQGGSTPFLSYWSSHFLTLLPFRRSEEGPRSFSDAFNSFSCWVWRATDVHCLVHRVLDIVFTCNGFLPCSIIASVWPASALTVSHLRSILHVSILLLRCVSSLWY